VSAATAPDRYGECADCDSPQGDIICRSCADEEWLIKLRTWLDRERTRFPGLTNTEVALIERLASDLECGT